MLWMVRHGYRFSVRDLFLTTKEEVQEAVDEMKAGRAPGLDCVATEYLKKGRMTIVEWLARLLNLCSVSGVVPIEWRSAGNVPLYKGK